MDERLLSEIGGRLRPGTHLSSEGSGSTNFVRCLAFYTRPSVINGASGASSHGQTNQCHKFDSVAQVRRRRDEPGRTRRPHRRNPSVIAIEKGRYSQSCLNHVSNRSGALSVLMTFSSTQVGDQSTQGRRPRSRSQAQGSSSDGAICRRNPPARDRSDTTRLPENRKTQGSTTVRNLSAVDPPVILPSQILASTLP